MEEQEHFKASQAAPDGRMEIPLSARDPLIHICRLAQVCPHVQKVSQFYPDEPSAPPCFTEFQAAAAEHLKAVLQSPNRTMDAAVLIWLTKENLEAWAAVLPPMNGGTPVSEDLLTQAMEDAEITTGISDRSVRILSDPATGYMRLTKLAVGTPAEAGDDGRILDLVSESEAALSDNVRHGKVDFSQTDWIQWVSAGQPLGRMIAPTAGTAGVSVQGKPTPAILGMPAADPVGYQAKLDEQDPDLIVAAADGQYINENGRLSVYDVLRIHGSVDFRTGNVKTNGSVVVHGNVMQNFRVEAGQDIVVLGTVDGGTVIGGRDVTVLGGVYASGLGSVKAGRDLRCRFIERGSAYAGRDAYFENLIRCDVSTEGSIYVLSGYGRVVGGSLTAMGDICVQAAGNRQNPPTRLTLDSTAEFLEAKAGCEQALRLTRTAQQKAELALKQLNEQEQTPQIRAAIWQLKDILQTHEVKMRQLLKRLVRLRAQEAAIYEHQIRVGTIFPNVAVRIGDQVRTIRMQSEQRVYTLQNGCIHSSQFPWGEIAVF